MTLSEEYRREKFGRMDEVSSEDRELVRSELVWVARRLRKSYRMTPQQIRRFLREMLEVSV